MNSFRTIGWFNFATSEFRMKNISTILFLLLLAVTNVNAQLANGSVCPDFTATDVQGNEWNLYELLDQDKKVVINLFAAWDPSSWSYYQSAQLQSLDSTYGSLGTGEVQVLFIEVEDMNSAAQLYGPAVGGSDYSVATQGDWITDNPFPVADSALLGELLEIAYLPTIYYVCPDRLIYNVGQYSAAQLENHLFQASCAPATFEVDPMIGYASSQDICETSETFLTVVLKNFGTTPLTAATLQLSDGESVYPFPWTGNLVTYESEELLLGPLELPYKRNYELTITTEDENPDNGISSLEAGVALSADTLQLELLLDAWPTEISWHITNDEGSVVLEGGNYTINYQYILRNFSLPGNGCYMFKIFDTSGDGLNGSQWGAFDGRCSLKSYNYLDSLAYIILDYDGSYGFSELGAEFEVNNDVALSVRLHDAAMKDFSVFPNPTNGQVNVRYTLPSSEVVHLEMRDVIGKLLMQENLGNKTQGIQQEMISIEELPAGIYMMSLKYGNKVHTTRVVKR